MAGMQRIDESAGEGHLSASARGLLRAITRSFDGVTALLEPCPTTRSTPKERLQKAATTAGGRFAILAAPAAVCPGHVLEDALDVSATAGVRGLLALLTLDTLTHGWLRIVGMAGQT